MSDFLFSTRVRAPGELRRALDRYLAPVTAACTEYHGSWGSLAVARAPHDPEPVFEDDRSLSVVIGEPFAQVGALGGAAAGALRPAVHDALKSGGERWDEVLDGPFAALFIDKRGGGRVLTDLFAWIPIFAAEQAGELVAGTHVDAVADAAGVRGDVDEVSATELLSFFVITHPHTLYAGVTQVGAGSERAFDADGWSGSERRYWRPDETDAFTSPAEAADALRAALVKDVERACEGLDEIGVLLSGGEDSRAVLGAVPRGVKVRGFTYAAEDNREVRSARRVARAYGASLAFARRPPGHDIAHFETVAALVGTQNHFVDVHGYGFHQSLGIAAMPVVLGGFSADALLKADNLPPGARKRVLRGETPGIRPVAVVELAGVRAELLRAAAERRDAFRRTLAAFRPVSADEWSFIYPFTMRKYAANLHGNRRLWRAREPFMSNAVVKIAASVPQAWKAERRLFHRAFRPLLAPSWYVPHTRNRLPYFPHTVNIAARPLLGLAREARALLTGTLRENQESWPVWGELVESPEARAAVLRYPAAESAMGRLFDQDSDRPALEGTGGWTPLRRLALLQLSYLTGGRP